MKSYTRRSAASANSKGSGNFSSGSSSGSKTSAAAVSVTKFGQATFTSVRNKDYENGNNSFMPLKKTLAEDGNHVIKEPEVKPLAPKPKVYKFFKSRTTTTTVELTENKNASSNAQPKPLMLNSEGVKRISTTIGKGPSTYTRNKNDKTSALNQSTLNKSDGKVNEIKSSHERSIKKVITPTKGTQFTLRNNNSNVRNATVQPVSTPNILSVTPSRKTGISVPDSLSLQATGVRTSRRLKGIEPEVINATRNSSSIKEASKDQHSTEILMTSQPKITTLIELSTENDNEEASEENISEKNDDLNEDNNLIALEAFEEPKQEEKIDLENFTLLEDKDKVTISQELTSITVTASQQSTTDIEHLKDELISDNNVVEESKLVSIRIPKKKIFFNRDRTRNKVEFNTKSFFASNTTDEFDIDLNENKAAPVVPSNSQEKKNVHEFEDDDQYIKLKRIKKAHQCHDLGETEQFDEDIKYYLSGIVNTNHKSMRCLSILGLSQQAMRPEFRMHLRAHDDMPRIIKALMDAPKDSNLAICTATLMLVYNQDRLTMDIDPNALSLMLELLETRSDECDQVEEKHRTKLEALVEEMKNKGHAKYLKLNEITAGKLAMETLLGLTSKRAGDWFKAELRKLKGIDFIVNTVLRCAENYAEEGQMVKIDRCMHVLENVTFNNVVNQLYVTEFNERKFISTCISLLENCKSKIISTNDSKIFLSAFFSILRVLTNLTSESVEGCKAVGSFNYIMELLLDSLFELPSFIMPDQRFDLMVIILCLCINLVEFCEHMREIVMTSERNMNRLREFLFRKIDEANQVEQQTDHLLESHETVQMTEAMQDNLLMQMISKSGTHMEHSLLSACVCLLFGCCIQENEEYMNILKSSLPNKSFDPLIEMLEKLRDFAHLADIMTQKGKDRVQRVLQIFKMYKKEKMEL